MSSVVVCVMSERFSLSMSLCATCAVRSGRGETIYYKRVLLEASLAC